MAIGKAAVSAGIPRPAPMRPRATKPAAIRPRRRVSSMRVPAKPMRAGSRVSEATTVRATVTEALTARPCTKGTPIRSMPRREMTTVMPANSTERPAVSMAMPTDSRTSWPAWSCSRYRVMIKSA